MCECVLAHVLYMYMCVCACACLCVHCASVLSLVKAHYYHSPAAALVALMNAVGPVLSISTRRKTSSDYILTGSYIECVISFPLCVCT